VTVVDFRLPSLGADMESATLVEWMKSPGDAVRRGETVAAVETDKGIIDIESYDEGKVAELLVQPGTKVPVGTVLARLNVEGAAAVVAPETARPSPPKPAEPVRARPTAPGEIHPLPIGAAPAPAGAPEHPARARISPAARRRAQELGMPLDALERAAAGAVVHVEDVERWAAQKPAKPPDARSAMRAAIGAAMARSKREIPHYYLAHSFDFGTANDWLSTYNGRVPVKERLIDAVLIIKAVALAAARIEGFNGYFRDGGFVKAAAVNVGTAIAVRGGGLVAPALLDADRKSLPALMQELSELVTRVRAGHMRSGEFSAATITVTSLGGDGVDVLYPIINPPQVAIVGTGAIREQPWVSAGHLAVRPILTLAVAGDHRVTDGRSGARFLRAIVELLARPENL
jgi:pyruvate dehydrogenase E2 component (dihydrolipoamide acetyltransferase)